MTPGCGGPAVHATLRIIGYSPLQILEIWVKWSMHKLSKDISTLLRGGLFETRSHAVSELAWNSRHSSNCPRALAMLLPLPLKCWHYKHKPACMVEDPFFFFEVYDSES